MANFQGHHPIFCHLGLDVLVRKENNALWTLMYVLLLLMVENFQLRLHDQGPKNVGPSLRTSQRLVFLYKVVGYLVPSINPEEFFMTK